MIDLRHLFLDLVIFSLFIFFSCKEFKSYRNDGILHFWQGMTLAFMTYVPATLIFLIGIIAMFYFDSNLLIDFKSQAVVFMESNRLEFLQDMTDDQFNERVAQIKGVTATQMTSSATFKKLMAGFFVSPVITVILRKKPN
jgi:preprotein translocase subunit SecF